MSNELPDHLRRYPTRAAIDALAQRFGLPNEHWMQDREYEVADCARIDEFVGAYRDGDLSEDERFVLMETILQSFEDLGAGRGEDPRWSHVLGVLDSNFDVHVATVWYWAALEDDLQDAWDISPDMRALLGKYRARFDSAG